ncbi:MAG: hypothetical protein JWM28_1592 [Chitinophagaceae bacterium]|nr:hypothetical protein [Chitinophagaceae bacterium]
MRFQQLARIGYFFTVVTFLLVSCKKEKNPQPPVVNEIFKNTAITVDGRTAAVIKDVGIHPVIRFSFSAPVNKSLAAANMLVKENNAAMVPLTVSFGNGDSTVIVTPQSSLKNLTKYGISVSAQFQSAKNVNLLSSLQVNLLTTIDSTDKFPLLSDSALLDLLQKQTLKYFHDFAHPVSGLARERNSSGDLVTSGGSGMGIMAIIAGVNRSFITRTQGLTQLTTIVNFLTGNVKTYHGAFPHWLNGATGATIPFSPNDDGADLVETSYLMQGLLCARQYFNGMDSTETDLRNKINSLWNNVEWDWFRQNNQNTLYWHWSEDKNWIMNFPVRGWNEALITYVLAASSNTHSIDQPVYVDGWAQNGAIKNGANYYGYQLPLGPASGGPLFFEHYSFLGINPNGLNDQFANYQTQTLNHTLINYSYCKTNPGKYFGYSDACWGLTASDDPAGYAAHEPNNDNGVITPSAALSSFPYTPAESMKALKFFYYKLGDKLWKEYGFVDAFNLDNPWFANSFLAIDQGPIIIMIENYRTGLFWNLLTGCPEVKTGLLKLGFTAPYL